MTYSRTYRTGDLNIKVFTNNRAVTRLIGNLLDFKGSRASRPGVRLKFRINASVSSGPDPGSRLSYRTKPDGILTISSGNKDVNMVVDAKTGMARGTVTLYKAFSSERVLGVIFIQPLLFLLARHGLYLLHASVVYKKGDCVIIGGAQDSGKSTVALALRRKGFAILSDDKSFVKLEKARAVLFPFPTKMGLKEEAIDRYPALKRLALKNYRYGGKLRIRLNLRSPCFSWARRAGCRMIIFPRYKEGGKIRMREIPRKRAMSRLLKEMPSVYSGRDLPGAVWAMYKLVKNACPFDLMYNDGGLDRLAGTVEAVLGGLSRESKIKII